MFTLGINNVCLNAVNIFDLGPTRHIIKSTVMLGGDGLIPTGIMLVWPFLRLRHREFFVGSWRVHGNGTRKDYGNQLPSTLPHKPTGKSRIR